MKKYLLIITLFFFAFTAFSQEYIFKFNVNSKQELNTLTKIISIDNYKDGEVTAYANPKEFKEFKSLGYKYELLPHPSEGKSIIMATTVTEMANWDRYPTYDVYIQMMNDFATNYPDLCQVVNIGTSEEGRQLLAVKISDNVSTHEAEPEYFYTGTMHGDETAGFVLLLRLIDHLLSNYGTDSRIANLLNNNEIYINPAANPDGTYNTSNNTVSGATRYNSNGVDLNRNFPSPTYPSPTYQNESEIQAMIVFADAHHFVFSANTHGGAEVVNYPWDAWTSDIKTHADHNWLDHVSHNYSDSVHVYSPSSYLDGWDNGVTHGGDWYVVNGSRQDHMTFYQNCREITLELSNTKLLDVENLPAHWDYNRSAFIGFIEEMSYGFNGKVTDFNTGNPLDAKIEILSHDEDNSWVVTDPVNGDYYRPIEPGTYTATFSSIGYIPQTHTITVTNWKSTTIKNVILGTASNLHSLTGTVTEHGSGVPIENVQIEILDNTLSSIYTNVSGDYSFPELEIGTYYIVASKNGYSTDTLIIEMLGNDEILNFSLKPNVTITGTVTEEGTGTPLENVKIEIIGSGLTPVFTNSSGTYSIDNVSQTTQNIKASLAGYTAVIQTIDISSTTVIDYTLSISNAISFETDIPVIFTFGGNADWTRVSPEAYDGDYSMKSGLVPGDDNQISVMESELNIISAGNISFYKKVSSESGYDYLHFYIDGVEQGSGWSGNVDWSQESYPVTTTGIHTFKWEYSKDGSVDDGSDCAWIDYIELPEYEEPATYTVTFNVTDGSNPIESANVNFNSQNFSTNSSGQAVFIEVDPGTNLPWNVSKTGYDTESGTVTVTNDNITQTVTLTETVTYTVTFNVDDGTNTIEGATVNFNSQNIDTDASGQAVFTNINAQNNIPYIITKIGFTTVNNTVSVVDIDVEENVSMSEVSYTVTFNITDNSTPVEDANINFNSVDILTDINGQAFFTEVTPANNIAYNITKSGYSPFNGQINVIDQDIEMNIPLTSVSVDVLLSLSGIKVSPNPFNEFTTFEFSVKETTPVFLGIYSYNGQLIKTLINENLNAGTHTVIWNGSNTGNQSVSNGIYFCKLIYSGNSKSEKIILIR